MYRIFLVEDDEVIAGAIADGLTRWGFEPYICNDFQNVTEEFLACDPHLTLLDISLPFYNGYHWCSEIRKISKTPIMFISSADDDMNIIMAINMGGDDFISKPFDLSVLTANLLRCRFSSPRSRLCCAVLTTSTLSRKPACWSTRGSFSTPLPARWTTRASEQSFRKTRTRSWRFYWNTQEKWSVATP